MEQDYPKGRFELIVVDGDSSDGTRAIVQRVIAEHPELSIRLLENPGRLSSRARNIGVRASRGELIAVIDAHVHIPTSQLLATMEALKEGHRAECLSRPAPLLVPKLARGKAFWIAVARKCRVAHSQNSYIYSDYEGFVDPVSSGFAYDRKVFERVGFFDEAFDACEDVEFHHRLKRAGIMAYTSSKLTIYSYPRDSLSGLFRQMMRYGIGRCRCLGKHRDAFTKEQLIPPGLVAYFLLLPVICFVAAWTPWVAAGYAVGFACYWLALLTSGVVATLRQRRIAPSLFVVAAIWVIHMGLGYGFLAEFVSAKVRPARRPM
jgi:glycosyltransferase involved in cell wall biosynthesis